LPGLELGYPGAFQSYLRTALKRRVVDEIRRSKRRPSRTALGEQEDQGPDPHEIVAGDELATHYLRALQQLRPLDRALLLARIDRGWSYERIAQAFGKKTTNATRVAITRALQRLTKAAEAIAASPRPRPRTRRTRASVSASRR
jgi:RNA polymerase sigma factor (sigma-70 family)